MSLTICEEHGKSGIALICPHLHDGMLSGDTIPDFVEMKFYRAEVNEEVSPTYPLCLECLRRHSLPVQPGTRLSWYEWFEQLELEPVCGACFKDYKSNPVP